jgi:DNA-binding SARP family transcriptional activator
MPVPAQRAAGCGILGLCSCPPNGGIANLISLNLLGAFSLRVAGAEVRLSRKTQALFVLLGTHFPDSAEREHLAYFLWPDQPDGLARHGLRNSLFEARKALGAAAPSLLGSNGTRLWLIPDTVEIDTAQFAAAATAASPDALKSALGLFRGEFAAGLKVGAEPFDDWVEEQRRNFTGQVQEGYRRLVSLSLDHGDTRTAVDAARRLIGFDALSEINHRALIDALSRSGQRTEALRQFRRCTEILQAELDIDPEPETIALARRIEQAVEPADVGRPEVPNAFTSLPSASRADRPKPARGPVEEVLGR